MSHLDLFPVLLGEAVFPSSLAGFLLIFVLTRWLNV
jgi:hypothetical protein